MLNSKEKGSPLVLGLGLALIIAVLDQVSKMMVTKTIPYAAMRPIIPDFFDLTLRYNKGAAYSFLADASGWQRWLFAGIGIIASLGIIFWLSRLSKQKKLEAMALSLILGGAMGNLIDRIRLGSVVDFIVLHYQHWEWPAFNIADTAISFGAVFLIASMFQKEASKTAS